MLGAAADERSDGYVSLASGVLRGRSADGSRTTIIAADMTDKPALFVADTMTSFVSHGLTFNLDVPCVMNGGAAFAGMVTAARQLAAGLNGTVVDDNRVPLTQQALDMIRAKIVEFQDVMAKHGIAAGSATFRNVCTRCEVCSSWGLVLG